MTNVQIHHVVDDIKKFRLQGRYLAPAAMQQHPAVSMAAQHHTAAMASSHHDPSNGSPAGIMSPTSPTSQPQIIYHPQHPAQVQFS